jgi:hypothetical protein
MSEIFVYSLTSISIVVAVFVIVFVIITLCLNWIECCVKRNYMQIPFGSYVVINEKLLEEDKEEQLHKNIIDLRRPETKRGGRETLSPVFFTRNNEVNNVVVEEHVVEYEYSDESPTKTTPNSSPDSTPDNKNTLKIRIDGDDDDNNDNKPIATSTIILPTNNQEPSIEFNIKMNTYQLV